MIFIMRTSTDRSTKKITAVRAQTEKRERELIC